MFVDLLCRFNNLFKKRKTDFKILFTIILMKILLSSLRSFVVIEEYLKVGVIYGGEGKWNTTLDNSLSLNVWSSQIAVSSVVNPIVRVTEVWRKDEPRNITTFTIILRLSSCLNHVFTHDIFNFFESYILNSEFKQDMA